MDKATKPITSLPELENRVDAARAHYENVRDGSDRGNNPRRASREAQEAGGAWSTLQRAEATLAAARTIVQAGLAWRCADFTLEIQGPDGSWWKAARSEDLPGQIALLLDPAAYGYWRKAMDQQRALLEGRIESLSRYEPKRDSWVFERLAGIDKRRIRKTLYVETGLMVRDDNDYDLTSFGDRSGLFIWLVGEYGSFYLLTPVAIRWVYETYLAGKCPMTKGAVPVRNDELDAIVKLAPEPGYVAGLIEEAKAARKASERKLALTCEAMGTKPDPKTGLRHFRDLETARVALEGGGCLIILEDGTYGVGPVDAALKLGRSLEALEACDWDETTAAS